MNKENLKDDPTYDIEEEQLYRLFVGFKKDWQLRKKIFIESLKIHISIFITLFGLSLIFLSLALNDVSKNFYIIFSFFLFSIGFFFSFILIQRNIKIVVKNRYYKKGNIQRKDSFNKDLTSKEKESLVSFYYTARKKYKTSQEFIHYLLSMDKMIFTRYYNKKRIINISYISLILFIIFSLLIFIKKI